jgi:hypothetical protein
MDTKAYSLNDIFALLHESTPLLGSKSVTVISGANSEHKTQMSLAEYVAMKMATELTSDTSRMASSAGPMAEKADVEAALAANHWSELTYPNYPHDGLIMSGGQNRRRTRRRFNR